MVDKTDIVPYIPIYHRPPNKFVRYEDRRFVCGPYNGTKRVAVFVTKGGEMREEVAQVIWDDGGA